MGPDSGSHMTARRCKRTKDLTRLKNNTHTNCLYLVEAEMLHGVPCLGKEFRNRIQIVNEQSVPEKININKNKPCIVKLSLLEFIE